jgi:hypothetical protein
MARAARALPETEASNDFVAAGYSQGGHASLFAGQMANGYAPELKLRGVAASAPPTDLGALIRETSDDPLGRVFVTFALASWSQLYGISTEGVVPKHLGLVVKNIASGCNLDTGQTLRLLFAEQAFEREGFLKEGVDERVLGPNLLTGERPQLIVPAGVWQAAESLGNWSLVGCTVAPGFRFEGFEMAPKGWEPA